jgi:uncharacterized iron-regulated membrane protein
MMRSWIRRLHLWIAALAGAFFVVLGLSGSILAFQQPLDHVLHPHLSFVAPSGHTLSLTEIIRSVKITFPQDNVVAITLDSSPRMAWEVALPSGIAYLNPHTGQVLGLRQRGQTLLGLAGEVHVSLAAGHSGLSIVRWSNLAALLLLISGIVLWWPERRIRISSFDGSRKFWADLHKSLGAMSFPFLLIAAGTGALISFEAPIRQMIQPVGAVDEAASSFRLPSTPSPDAVYMDADRALALAKTVVPNASPTRIQMPLFGGTYQISMVEHRSIGADIESVVTLDPYSGKTLAVSSNEHGSFADRLFAANESLHTGSILGVAGRTLMALAGFMVLLQAICGLVM